MSVPKSRPDVPTDEPETDQHAPRRLTFTENVALTIKLLGGLVLVGIVLWAVDLWTAS